jgi:hypothetical protein
VPLADRILAALIAHENDKPRSKQLRLGPSELGGCREYMRNIMVGTPMQDNGDVWPTAAVVGTLIGAHMESVLAERMDALTEVNVTTTLPNGLKINGHADIVLVEDNAVVDCKSKDQFATINYEGPSLDNLVQVSVYTLGLVQNGVLKEGATAHLIYVDRSGNEQTLVEVELAWETILDFVDKAVARVSDVIEAQDMIDQGILEAAHHLRDKTPTFCFSKKVLCPFRDACWKGSEWLPHEVIEDQDVLKDILLFREARDEQNASTQRRKEYRSRLEGISGITPDGWSVTWSEGKTPMLYVTKVK